MGLGGEVKKQRETSCHETNVSLKLELPRCQEAFEMGVRRSSGPDDMRQHFIKFIDRHIQTHALCNFNVNMKNNI